MKLLRDDIVSQIAAGEVIENPGAVVKELVENSIDSGADEIEILIEDSGLKRIQVIDDGGGISKDDLLKAPLRHATSKIESFNDLYNINTMGFRGEALASIFSVAKARVISRLKEQDVAYEISSENVDEVRESSCSKSTTVIVEDLFYNTPARRKYLKSGALELKAIVDIVNRFEVFYNNVKITLKHNGKILVNKPSFKDMKENLFYVLGRELRGNLLELDGKRDGIMVYGFMGKPSSLTYSFRKNQYVYVNGRFVKSKLIRDAIYDGFGSNLMINRYPFFVVFINIDPEIIDVNIHPTKIEVKFENEEEIYELVRRAIEKQFETKEMFKEFESDRDLDLEVYDVEVAMPRAVDGVEEGKAERSKYYSGEKQKSFVVNEDELVIDERSNEESYEDDRGEDVQSEKKGVLYEELREYKILGQLNKMYIVIETPKEFLLVDQHVCEEKYYYERFKEQFKGGGAKTQSLLKPQIVHLTNSEMLLYDENKDVMEKIGFRIERFGENEVLVREVPVNVRQEIVHAQNLRDILHNVLVNRKIKCVEEEKYSKIASMSCRISVMAGDELTMPQMRRMIENLKTLKQPFNCPHGRPTFLRYSYKDLEKKFKRVV